MEWQISEEYDHDFVMRTNYIGMHVCKSTIQSVLTLIVTALAFANTALSAPVGICLHAYSPEAPADKIECFEFTKFEQIAEGYRFFLQPNGSKVVTKYRYRGKIIYEPNIRPGHPEFEQTLKTYEVTARSTPSTRRYLNPRITEMRYLAAEQTASQQVLETLPKIVIGGTTYLDPSFNAIENGKLTLKHKDGFAKIELEKISDAQIQALVKIDPEAAKIKVIEISKNRLWNPRFEGTANGRVKIAHENGILSLEFESISEKDKKTIMSWSDGTWKIGKPGFYNANPDGNSYGELILESGRFHADAELVDRDGESIIIKTPKTKLKLPISQLATIPGISAQDSTRMEAWTTEIINERLDRAKPEASTKVLAFNEAEVLRVTNVRVEILQVFDEGVLASKFIGKLHKGTESVQTTKTVKAEHPVTGEEINRVVDTSIDDFEVTEDVTDDLCYIVGNTSNLTEGQIVKADSMRLLGRYQYTDVAGRPRTVRKYHVD